MPTPDAKAEQHEPPDHHLWRERRHDLAEQQHEHDKNSVEAGHDGDRCHVHPATVGEQGTAESAKECRNKPFLVVDPPPKRREGDDRTCGRCVQYQIWAARVVEESLTVGPNLLRAAISITVQLDGQLIGALAVTEVATVEVHKQPIVGQARLQDAHFLVKV